MPNLHSQFPDFTESIDQVKKFKASGDLFSLMLKDGSIVHYTSRNPEAFRQWLISNNIEDIQKSAG